MFNQVHLMHYANLLIFILFLFWLEENGIVVSCLLQV